MLQMTIRKQIGTSVYTFIVAGEDLHDVVMQSRQLSFPDVFQCGMCHNKNLRLAAYVTEKESYEYTKIICTGCKATLTFGITKKDGAFFLRRRDDGAFDWQEYQEPSSTSARRE